MASKSQREVEINKDKQWKQKKPLPFPAQPPEQLNLAFPPIAKIHIARSRHLRDLLHRLVDELHGEIQALVKAEKRSRKKPRADGESSRN